MTTRYTAKSRTRFGTPGLPSGYESKSLSDFTVPAVGIEDVDKALFTLFNEEIPLLVGGDGTDLKRAPVIFFAGEKWALNKRLRALKDRNNALILPLITIVRTILIQDPVEDITGRGINQQTGEIVIHRQLDKSDRGYQGLINRLLLGHQQGLAVSPSAAEPGQLSTLRTQGDLASDPTVQQGGLLVGDRTNNVFETVVVPAPQFFTAQYDVTFWTQYTAHMNQLLEQMLASQLPQGNSWRLDTPKGYWFVAHVDANTYTADTNTDDYSQTERLVRYKFVVKVPGYVLATSVPGAPVPIKRYVSSPTISFETGVDGGIFEQDASVPDPFLGSDDPTLPLDVGNNGLQPVRRDQRYTDGTRLHPPVSEINPQDPALKSLRRGTNPGRYRKVTGIGSDGKPVTQYFKVKGSSTAQGETVLASDANLGALTIVVVDD